MVPVAIIEAVSVPIKKEAGRFDVGVIKLNVVEVLAMVVVRVNMVVLVMEAVMLEVEVVEGRRVLLLE